MFNMKFTPKAAILIGTVLASTSAIACDIKDLAGTYRYYSNEPRLCTIEINSKGSVKPSTGPVDHCHGLGGSSSIIGGRFKFHKTASSNNGTDCWISGVVRFKTSKLKILEAMAIRDVDGKILMLTGFTLPQYVFTMANFTGGRFNPNVARKLQR